MMPAGTDWPRITARLMASRSMAMLMAWRTRLSANGFLPLTLEVLSSGEATSMPKKMVRFSGPMLTFRLAVFSRAVDVLRRHVLHEIDLARQQGGDAGGVGLDHVKTMSEMPTGTSPLPQYASLRLSTVLTSCSRETSA